MDGPGQVAERRCDRHSGLRDCPRWCVECRHDTGPEDSSYHLGQPHEVGVYGETAQVLPAKVRAAYLDKLPEDRGHGPAELERPHVTLEVDDEGVYFSLTPAQARQLAAALLLAAETADTGPVSAALD